MELDLYMQGYTRIEIAEMTNQPLGTVRSKILMQEKEAKRLEAK